MSLSIIVTFDYGIFILADLMKQE